MTLIEIIIIGISLAMDAFAVSVSNGICSKGQRLFNALLCGIIFGLYQGVMPAIGYALGSGLGEKIEKFDHYIALILLGFIGVKMIMEALTDNKRSEGNRLTLPLLMVQGFATSVDALAVGVSLAALSADIVLSSAVICVITLVIAFSGYCIGSKFGCFSSDKAEIAGGTALILIGIRIFLSHVL